jgi:acetaldehyde dehydrogenase (acetylating)
MKVNKKQAYYHSFYCAETRRYGIIKIRIPRRDAGMGKANGNQAALTANVEGETGWVAHYSGSVAALPSVATTGGGRRGDSKILLDYYFGLH